VAVVELEFDDGSTIEIDVSGLDESLDYAGTGDRVRKRAEDFVEGSLASMLKLVAFVRERAVASLSDSSEIEIAFALGVNARGDLKVVSGGATASISLKTVWRNGQQH
jgi:hypothetical protein